MIKKVFLTLLNILSVLIIAAAVIVLCLVLLTKPGEAPSLGGYTVFRVTTGSMKPTYDVDTLILVKKTDPSEIQVGDVISFYSADPALEGSVNTHRVTKVNEDGDHRSYTTKGDANNSVDQYGTDSDALIGKVIASSLLARLISNPLIFIPVILIPLAIILISNVVHTVKLAGKIAKDEEEAAVREAILQLKKQKEQKAADEKENKEKHSSSDIK